MFVSVWGGSGGIKNGVGASVVVSTFLLSSSTGSHGLFIWGSYQAWSAVPHLFGTFFESSGLSSRHESRCSYFLLSSLLARLGTHLFTTFQHPATSLDDLFRINSTETDQLERLDKSSTGFEPPGFLSVSSGIFETFGLLCLTLETLLPLSVETLLPLSVDTVLCRSMNFENR